MRKKILAGNWKMNNDAKEAVDLAKAIASVDIPDGREVMIAPAFPCLSAVKEAISGSKVNLGAQNFYFEDKGAYTGEVSSAMLKSVGVSYVILGHSERRAIFNESNDLINKKVKKAIEEGFIAVLCCGELLEQREAGQANDVVKEQVIEGLSGVSEKDLASVVIAYEPVWAIGTGKTASPEDANEMHAFIRTVIKDMYTDNAAEELTILYGGSVKDSNIDALMATGNIDGGLVGGAALDPENFKRIIQYQ